MDALLEEFERVTEEPPEDVPARLYDIFPDGQPAPAVYAEVEATDTGAVVPVIVHNFQYYEAAMRRWEVDLIELMILNELHELTHWAMTDEERERFDTKSRALRQPDGYWFNPTLVSLIDWLPRDHPAVAELTPTFLERVGDSLRRFLGRNAGAGAD